MILNVTQHVLVSQHNAFKCDMYCGLYVKNVVTEKVRVSEDLLELQATINHSPCSS